MILDSISRPFLTTAAALSSHELSSPSPIAGSFIYMLQPTLPSRDCGGPARRIGVREYIRTQTPFRDTVASGEHAGSLLHADKPYRLIQLLVELKVIDRFFLKTIPPVF